MCIELSDELIELLRSVTIFAGMDDSCLRRFFNRCELLNVHAGEEIIKENTQASEIFIVIKGKLKIVLDSDGDQFEIAEMGPGNCVGEASVIGVQTHSATAMVTEDSQLLVLSRKDLMRVFDEDKELFSLLILNIARELARRLRRTDEILLHYTKRNSLKLNN